MIELDQVDVEQETVGKGCGDASIYRPWELGRLRGQSLTDTEHPVMITVSEHSETRDM